MLGFAFLLCKGLEYREDILEHLIPGSRFSVVAAGDPIVLGPLLDHDRNSRNPSHGGIGVVLVVATLFHRRIIPVQGSTLEGLAIYWHFVDSVWIVLYPLLYLAGRS